MFVLDAATFHNPVKKYRGISWGVAKNYFFFFVFWMLSINLLIFYYLFLLFIYF